MSEKLRQPAFLLTERAVPRLAGLLLLVSGLVAVPLLITAPVSWSVVAGQEATITPTPVFNFLPLILNSFPSSTPTSPPTATPTPPTATPTATLAPPLLAIPNGDFEQGPSAGWIEYRSYANRPLIVQNASGLPVTPRSGQWFAWLGGDHLLGETVNHQSRIVHANTFALPPNSPIYLHLYYQIISEQPPDQFGVCDRDVVNLWINDNLIYQGSLCQLTNTNGWTLAVVDLSLFAGQNVTLEFEVRTDDEDISHIFLDDISFQATP